MKKYFKIILISYLFLDFFIFSKPALALVPGSGAPNNPLKSAGERCDRDFECTTGLVCILRGSGGNQDRVCSQPVGSTNIECTTDDSCSNGFCQDTGDSEKRFCVANKLNIGDRCNRDAQCMTLFCDGNKCALKNQNYQNAPLEPKLQINIPGVSFSKLFPVQENEQSVLYIPFIAEYFAGLYKYLIAIVGIFAGVMIAYAGVKWMLAAGNPEAINTAKHKIGDAIIGLILAVSSYTILYLVNPDLVTFKALRIPVVERIEDLSDGDVLDVAEGSLTLDPKAQIRMSNLCDMMAIENTANFMVDLNACIGPNHCVWFVNRVLFMAGCPVNTSNIGYGPSLKKSLQAAGWKTNPGDISKQLGAVTNIAVIHKKKGHYALVIKTGPGHNIDKDFTCYESNYAGSGVTKIFTAAGEGCSKNSVGNQCKACERFLYEGPTPVAWNSYARRYEKNLGGSPNQAFIKHPGVCGKSAEFFTPQ